MLKLIGNAFAGRIAANLLTAIGLPELITETQPAYESLAIEPGVDRPRLSSILQEKFERNHLTTPLFDTGAFAGHIESAYIAVHERARAGGYCCKIRSHADGDIGHRRCKDGRVG